MTIDQLIELSKELEVSQELVELLCSELSEKPPSTTLEFLSRSYNL